MVISNHNWPVYVMLLRYIDYKIKTLMYVQMK